MSSTSSILQGVNKFLSGNFLNPEQQKTGAGEGDMKGGVIPRHRSVSHLRHIPRSLHIVKHRNVVLKPKVNPFTLPSVMRKISPDVDELSNLFGTIKIDRRRGSKSSTRKSKSLRKQKTSSKSSSKHVVKSSKHAVKSSKRTSPNVDDLVNLFKRTSLSAIQESPKSSRPSRSRKAPERLTYHKKASSSRSKK